MIKKMLFFLVLCCTTIVSVHAIEPNVIYSDRFYSNRINERVRYSGQIGYTKLDDKILYCLDPHKLIGSDYVIDNSYFNTINEDDLNYMKAIANFVKNKVYNNNIFYYMTAQEMIWERMYRDDDIYWTTENDGVTNIINLDPYKNEIQRNIKKDLTKPSFDGEYVESGFRSILIFEDKNNVLSDFEIVGEYNNEVWKDGNKLYVKITSSKPDTIKLVSKKYNGEAIYYHSDTSQDLAYLEAGYDLTATVDVRASNIYNETINLKFYDNDTGNAVSEMVYFRIKNLETGQYVLDSYTSDGNYLLNLSQGEYTVEVYQFSSTYLKTEFDISVNESNYIDQVHNFYIALSKAKGEVHIINNDYVNLEFYSNQGLISNINETVILNLDLGYYYLIDKDSGKRYDIKIEYKDAETRIIIVNVYVEKQTINNYDNKDQNEEENNNQAYDYQDNNQDDDNQNNNQNNDNQDNDNQNNNPIDSNNNNQELIDNLNEEIYNELINNQDIYDNLKIDKLSNLDYFLKGELPNTSYDLLNISLIGFLCLSVLKKLF